MNKEGRGDDDPKADVVTSKMVDAREYKSKFVTF